MDHAQLLEPKIGAITVDDLKAALRDHFGSPRAICRHPHEYPGNGPAMTISSQIFGPVNSAVHIAAGQPCESSYCTITQA